MEIEKKEEEIKKTEKTEETPAPEPEKQPTPAPESKPEPVPQPAPEPESKPEPEPEPTPEPEPENKPTVADDNGNQPVNAIRVEDLVTKADLKEKLDAIISRLDSVLHENETLKDQLAKYDGDFGNTAPKGATTRDEKLEDTFESYSRDFM